MKSTMKTIAAGLLGLTLSVGVAWARTGPVTLEDHVRHELLMVPYIGVFDNVQFSLDQNGAVTLSGQVVRPIDKSNLENAVKSAEGVTAVNNQIEVLPLSTFDDQIRFATLRRLERTNPLNKYFWGVHPDLRIIVKNGNVTLEGTVLNDGDRNLANIAANSVPGVFHVTNNLRAEK